MGSVPSTPSQTQEPVLEINTVQGLDIPKRNTNLVDRMYGSPLLSVDTHSDDLEILNASSKKRKDKVMVPVQVFWNAPGKSVFVTGTFNGWKQRIILDKVDQEFSTIIQMPIGTQHLKFIVDEEWKCSQDLPIASDEDGNLINYLQISLESKDIGDGLDDLSESFNYMNSIKDQTASSPPGSYSTNIPDVFTSDTVPLTVEEPLPLPIYLEKVLLNHKVVPKDPTTLQTPSHVSLNHLYTCSIRDNVLSTACTSR